MNAPLNPRNFRSAAQLGARLSQAALCTADELAIAALAEETVAKVLNMGEATLRTVLANAIASPHNPERFQDVHGEYVDGLGRPFTQAEPWRYSLIRAVADFLERGNGLKPYWATRRRSLTVLEGGGAPSARRRHPKLKLVQGGAS